MAETKSIDNPPPLGPFSASKGNIRAEGHLGNNKDELDGLKVEDNEESVDYFEENRIKIKFFMRNSTFGQVYEFLFLVLSVASSLEFVYETYLVTGVDDSEIAILKRVELIVAILFSFDWLLSFLLSDHKLLFFNSFFSMIDLATVIPVFVALDVDCVPYNSISNFRDVVVYIICAVSTTRVLRALRIRTRFLSKIEDDVQRGTGEMVITIIVMIMFYSALIKYLEEHEQNLPYHTWMYVMVVTIGTVGYGDISPVTPVGRYADIANIATNLIVVPLMANSLIEKMAKQSIYSRAAYQPRSKKIIHVVICGDIQSSSMEELLAELFHEDHDAANLHAVILNSDPPSLDLLNMLDSPEYVMVTTYLQGTALSDKDLRRCEAHNAKGIFIMTNKFSSNPDKEDAKIILQHFNIKRYIASKSPQVFPTILLQLIRPENKRHLLQVSSNKNNSLDFEDSLVDTDLFVVLNDIKMGIIAKAAMFPGVSTLVMNLMSSFANEEDEEDENVKGDDEVHTRNDNWLHEYQQGCDWEIYCTEISDIFEGSKFVALSEKLYEKFGLCLFGLRIEDLNDEKRAVRMILNPGDYVIPLHGRYKIDALVIAKNQQDAEIISRKLATENSNRSNLKVSQLNSMVHQVRRAKMVTEVEQESEIESISEAPKTLHSWQELLRRNRCQKGNKESQQEEIQKMHEAYLRSNYFMRDLGTVPLELQDVSVSTTVMEEFPNVKDHIIVVGDNLMNLYDLILPLRAKYLGILQYIVILYPYDFPISIWQKIRNFQGLVVVRGSSLEDRDMKRAGIFKASQVIVIANQHESKDRGHADSNAIFTYQYAKKMNDKIHIVIELIDHHNVVYLDPNLHNLGKENYKLAPQFAGGQLFTTSLLDTIVCQSFYNSDILKILSKLVSGHDVVSQHFKKNTNVKDIFAIRESCLYQISLPDGLESRTYGSLYKFLSQRNMLPLGIYRGIFSNTKEGAKKNKLPFVYTNPPKDTELFSCDKVYILSQKPVMSGKLSLKEVEKELNFLTELRHKRNLVDDIDMHCTSIDQYMEEVEEKVYKLSDQISGISEKFDEKIDKLLVHLQKLNDNEVFKAQEIQRLVNQFR